MNLSKLSIELVKSTSYVIEENAEAITSKMYSILFEKYPETKELFRNASEDQHKKLAQAIASYAENIDNLFILDMLAQSVERIAKTHVTTLIKAEHYPMVGESLLQAMKEELVDKVSKDVLKAWEEAYYFLADILITKEKELYQLERNEKKSEVGLSISL